MCSPRVTPSPSRAPLLLSTTSSGPYPLAFTRSPSFLDGDFTVTLGTTSMNLNIFLYPQHNEHVLPTVSLLSRAGTESNWWATVCALFASE